MNTLLCNVGEYGVIVNQQEEFLIVKLAASEKFPEEKRMLPGGRLQENDYPELGLQREVKEET
jgi:8-oxo-dGTP pyrophosphatase MutT (NUDIX family)